MFKHILVPTDGSELSQKAAIYAAQLAKPTGGRLTALSVKAPYFVTSMDAVSVVGSQEQYDKEARGYAERALTQVSMAAEAAGVKVESVQETHDQPYQAIVDCAAANHCDLIVMASHGRRGVSALLLGSETQKVLTHSKVPVLVYR
jgi:nucleotide-binding universal stress UspA family protein